FLSGGGLAMFYAVIALVPGIAAAAGVNGILIALPMQMIANLARGISPVAAVIMIVAASIKVEPTKVLKRTSVPSIVGIISVLVLSVLLLPY
ncbi:MAG: C4-dicarboxylate ABC transporter, partial [Bifidobacteriales bacterium]|nr:C4-dicarboxylate ABC transporter [Bifidobacteriales bacterium]